MAQSLNKDTSSGDSSIDSGCHSMDSGLSGMSSMDSSDSGLHSNTSSNSKNTTYGNFKPKFSHLHSEPDDMDTSAVEDYGSCPMVSSVTSYSDEGLGDSVSLSNSHSGPSRHVEKAKPTVQPTSSKHFQGTLLMFLQTVLATIKDFRSWDPVKDIKEKLSPTLLEEARTLLWKQDDDKDFEALNAAKDGDELVVAFALYCAKSHKQLNTMNEDRQTVLHIAAQKCTAPLCRLLITRGADGAIADVWGDTPLHIAARCGRADVVKALTTTLTKHEVHHPYFRVPYKSLPQDNVQSYNHDGRTPIHLAAQESDSQDHRDALRALVRHARADIDYRRLGDGYAPAHIAIDNDDMECLKTCLKLGADSEVRNFKSETPHQLAYLFNDNDEEHEMVKLCQKYGAGEYQLEYAETESVSDCEDMDYEQDEYPAELTRDAALAHRMRRMVVS